MWIYTNPIGSWIRWMWAYDSGIRYRVGDIVTYLSSSYIANDSTIANLPTDTDFWDFWAIGDKWDAWVWIDNITRTSWTGLPWSTDIYTITYTDATTDTFTVYNGINWVNWADWDDWAAWVDWNTILSDATNPTTQWVDWDFFLNTATSTLFWPKAGWTWSFPWTELEWADWVDGVDGVDGVDWVDWTNGTNWTNGTDGIDWTDWADWRSIVSVLRTTWDWSAGTTDTYTITYSIAPLTSTFDVYNGADWIGSWDMLKTTYDTNDSWVVDNSETVEGKTVNEIKVDDKTWFDRFNLVTNWRIEVSEDWVNIVGRDGNWVKYTNSSWSFANWTAYQTAASARWFAIYPENWETEFSFMVNNTEFVKTGLEQITFANTTGERMICFDASWNLTSETDILWAFYTCAFISVIYWNATTSEIILFWEERHWRSMDTQTHLYNHITRWTQYVSWLWINWLANNSLVYTSTSSWVLMDEDITLNLPAQTNAPFWYLVW